MNSPRKKLFIIDSMALAFRSYYALARANLTLPNGIPSSCIYGSAVFLNKLITEEKPEYIVAVCESGNSNSVRKDLYENYKQNRKTTPNDLAIQIPLFFDLLKAHNISILNSNGYEGDDIAGVISKKLQKQDLDIYIVSSDKDLMQLLDSNTFLYSQNTSKKGSKNSNKLITDLNGVFEKFGCHPDQIPDYLALIGDTADNIPGVKGIGGKQASSLLQKYKTLEGIYENLENITKKQAELLTTNKDLAFISKELATIHTDLPIEISLEDFAINWDESVRGDIIRDLYKKYDFKSLLNKLLI